MFIELTDHLRCPKPHDEAFLVLLPDRMEGPRVLAGHLGCPFCGWSTDWDNGIPDFGGGQRLEEAPAFEADGIHAMLGIDGPGGWIALAGRAGLIAHELALLLPNVGIVAINPPPDLAASGAVSILTSGTWPIKSHALRGAVVGLDAAEWNEAALGSVLPSRHVVGEGEPLAAARGKILATAGGVWVVRSG